MPDYRRLAGPGLTLLAGAACAFAFAPADIPLLAPAALAVLFHLCARASPATAFRLGLAFGIGLFGVGVSWLHISINLFGGLGIVPASLLNLLLVLYMALFPATAAWVSARLRRRTGPMDLLLIQPAAWVIGEWLRGWLFTGFPWLFVGYTQIDLPSASIAPVLGVLGVSWLVAVTGGTGALILVRSRGTVTAAVSVLAFIAAASLGLDQVRWTRAAGEPRHVALVQGAIPPQVRWQAEFLHDSIRRYVGLTDPYWDSDIIIWPETAIPAFASQVPELLDALSEEARHRDVDLYAGFPTVDATGQNFYNSLLLMGSETGTYHKRHLVPFGEFTPFAPLFRGLSELLAIPMSNFTPGSAQQPLLHGMHGSAGISICYEDTFGAEIIEALPDAEYLINVSNDGWFGDSAAPHQHLQMARMRALETGRYMLRATNSGVSAIIAADGSLVATTALFTPTVLRGTVVPFAGMTPFARVGNGPVLLLCLLALLVPAWRRRQPSAA